MKTWNIGNTTIRNPERIKDGLRVFKDGFLGRPFNNREINLELFQALNAAGVIKGDPNDEGSRDWSGRKWGSVFNKLGLALPRGANGRNGNAILTTAGEALLDDSTLDSDIYLRQMLKVQLPSPTEDKLEGAAIHPFYLVLSTAVMLDRSGMKPLSKEEIALYMQSATSDEQASEIVAFIKEYRRGRDAIEGRTAKRRYFIQKLDARAVEIYGESTKQKRSTLIDYADTTMRYSSITGIFTLGRQSLVIKEDQKKLAEALVDAGPPKLLKEVEFFAVFHDPTLPLLPTDNEEFLSTDIAALEARVEQLSSQTGSTAARFASLVNPTINQLKRRRQDLESELISQKELEFYKQQGKEEQVEDILGVFESIHNREIIGGSDYMPAWAEWAMWRVFLSINTISNPISETRGFRIDSELYPIHHARGGGADLKFEYEGGFLIPAEITLNTSDRQHAAESEPVRTHVLRQVEQNSDDTVIGVFVAPAIQARTAHDFLSAHTSGDYSGRLGRVVKLDIVPLTIGQLCMLLPSKERGCKDATELRSKLDEILSFRDKCADGHEWLGMIDGYFAMTADV